MDENLTDNRTITDEELTQVSGGVYCGPMIVYTIQRGDTLSKIAARHGTTPAIIMELNNMTRTVLRPGHKLLIPDPKGR